MGEDCLSEDMLDKAWEELEEDGGEQDFEEKDQLLLNFPDSGGAYKAPTAAAAAFLGASLMALATFRVWVRRRGSTSPPEMVALFNTEEPELSGMDMEASA